jgi:hypothetical protein
MKNTILTIALVFLSIISKSQVITVKLDTTQFFSHDIDISTPYARDNDLISYDSLFHFPSKLVYKFNINNETLTLRGKEYTITEVNESSNILDVELESECPCMAILGQTTDDRMIFLVECKNKEKIFGLYCLDPEYDVIK